ncbi:MAG: cell envelope integrity EipB family protein [Hyphomicrobiales bacterium]|nr:cell envelope integrity EipB family protein [Hyphomicrobiales bacterium]
MTSAFKICAVLSLASISFGVSVLQAKEIGHAPDIKLAPHRAIYDMKLLRSQPGSNISSLDGFLSIEFTGSVCEGFVQSTQLVTSTVDWNGREVLTDMRSSSWEDGTGEKFHFRSKRFVNQQESEVIEGDAARDAKKKSIQIAMKSPAYNRLKIGGGAMFPTQHSIAVLEAANRGQFTLQADLYDGLDKGEKFYQTTTIIGKPIGDGASDLPAVANAEILNGMRAWPVTVSYFDSDKAGAITPSYEIAYRMYANGVSRKLRIDYGNFSVEGELNKIEFLKQVDCGTTATKPVKR